MISLENLPLDLFRRQGDETFEQEMSRIGVSPLVEVVGTQQTHDQEEREQPLTSYKKTLPSAATPSVEIPTEEIAKITARGYLVDITV